MYGNHGNKILNENSFLKPVSPYGTAKLYSYWITKNYRDALKYMLLTGYCLIMKVL